MEMDIGPGSWFHTDRFGLWGALGISALIFGFAHMINPSASIWSSVAIAIEAGVLLGAAYKYTNSLWFPIGIHWAWNFTRYSGG